MKFGVVGIIATVIDFLLLTILTGYFGVFYLFSAAISFIISTIFNYIASMHFVFFSRYDASKKHTEILLFLLLSAVGLILNQIFMWLFVDIIYIHYIIAKVIATCIVMLWNFVSRKMWLESKE